MPTTVEMIGEHIASEENASRVYRYFSTWCGLNGFPGSEAYFAAESKDELVHMEEFNSYWTDTASQLAPYPVRSQPELSMKIGSLADCFNAALILERKVLDELNAIGKQSMSENNLDAIRFLQKYTHIGVESIRELTTFAQQLERARSDQAAILVFDGEIGE